MVTSIKSFKLPNGNLIDKSVFIDKELNEFFRANAT